MLVRKFHLYTLLTMIKELLISGGLPFTVPLTLLGLLLLTLISIKVINLYVQQPKQAPFASKNLDVILFIGSLCFAYGVLGQTMGIYQMLQFISGARQQVSPQVIAGGLQISFIPSLYGLMIFIISALFWFLLRNRHQQLLRRTT